MTGGGAVLIEDAEGRTGAASPEAAGGAHVRDAARLGLTGEHEQVIGDRREGELAGESAGRWGRDQGLLNFATRRGVCGRGGVSGADAPDMPPSSMETSEAMCASFPAELLPTVVIGVLII